MEKQFVGFEISNCKYCIDIMEVKEVVKKQTITALPDAPYFVEGLMNLRGVIIPVISLKKKLEVSAKKEEEDSTKKTEKGDKLVIVNIEGVLVGFEVEKLDRVFSIDSNQIQATDRILEDSVDKSLIQGAIKIENSIYLILNTKKILDLEERSFIEQKVIE